MRRSVAGNELKKSLGHRGESAVSQQADFEGNTEKLKFRVGTTVPIYCISHFEIGDRIIERFNLLILLYRLEICIEL